MFSIAKNLCGYGGGGYLNGEGDRAVAVGRLLRRVAPALAHGTGDLLSDGVHDVGRRWPGALVREVGGRGVIIKGGSSHPPDGAQVTIWQPSESLPMLPSIITETPMQTPPSISHAKPASSRPSQGLHTSSLLGGTVGHALRRHSSFVAPV